MSNLTKDQRKFLVANVLVAFGSAVSNTFFNLFLFNLMNNDMYLMAILQLCKYACSVNGFFIGTYMARKYEIPKINAIGLIGLIITIFTALVGGDFATHHLMLFVAIIGVLWGTGEGFYWMSFNSLQQIMVSEQTRASFLGINGGLTNTASIFAPLLATFLVGFFGKIGYFAIFIIVMMNYFIAFIITNTLKIERSTDVKITYPKHPNWRMITQHKSMSRDFKFNITHGLREGLTMGFLSVLYIQVFQNNETIFGLFNTANAVIVVLVNFLFAKIFRRQITPKNVCLVMLPLSLCGIFFGLECTIIGALVFGVIYNFLNPAYLIITGMRSFSIIDKLAKNQEEKFVGLTFRELGMNVGRAISMLSVILLYNILGDFSIRFWMIFSHITFAILMCKYYKVYKSSKNHVFSDIK